MLAGKLLVTVHSPYYTVYKPSDDGWWVENHYKFFFVISVNAAINPEVQTINFVQSVTSNYLLQMHH